MRLELFFFTVWYNVFVLRCFRCSTESLVDRETKLRHNKIFRILKEERLKVLVNRAISGVNPDNKPATVSEAETKEICRAWLKYLCDSALARNEKIDQWTVSPVQFEEWATLLTECFPGEVKETWYSPAVFRKVNFICF